jgi:hypothetical protein
MPAGPGRFCSSPLKDLAFSHTILCQTSLPAARPPDDLLVWERRQLPIISVEDSMMAFFRRLMGRTQDGQQAAMLKQQLLALAASFRMGITTGEDRALRAIGRAPRPLMWLGISF